MLKKVRDLDVFTRNVILVFIGTSLINVANLFYQLLIAHSINPEEFAAFNTLIAIYMIISIPLGTLQTAIVKYSAQFNAKEETGKIKALYSFFLKSAFLSSLLSFFVFYLFSSPLMESLKIPFKSSGYILALLVASAWVIPVLFGVIQGLELFGWLMGISLLAGVLKLLFTFVFLKMGWSVFGALAAFLVAAVIEIMVCLFILRRYLSFGSAPDSIPFKEIFMYLIPIAVNSLCFVLLVSSDIIFVKRYFSPEQAGSYSLAQMLGKIFLFLPAAISTVLLPRASGLRARKNDTFPALRSSLFYGAIICLLAALFYNLFPGLVLRILTGKAPADALLLGRLFSISMTFFTLFSILTTYFLSIEDLRFIKFLVAFTLLQLLGVYFFHSSLLQVQLILCLNSAVLFFVTLWLSKQPRIHEA